MRRILIVASLLAMTTPSLAQWNHRHEHQRYQHFQRGYRGNSILPGLFLGLGAAAAIGTLYYYEGRQCWNESAGFDQWGRELVQRVCN